MLLILISTNYFTYRILFLVFREQSQPPAPRVPTEKNSVNLARHHSYGFFDDVLDDEWRDFYQATTLAAPHYRNTTHPNDRSDQKAWWYFMNWDPYFPCPHFKKVGGLGDGSK